MRPADFNSYGARRGNDDVMTRGTFANVRIKNEMVPGVEGGVTKYKGAGDALSIYDAAMKYKAEGTPLVVVAGKEYGTGSSRDWAAKGTMLLGVKVVIAESFERIHRSNLVGMGILPLQFKPGTDRKSLALDGTETFDIIGLAAGIKPRQDVTVTVTRKDGSPRHLRRAVPHRHAGRSRLLPSRRHSEIRAARSGRLRPTRTIFDPERSCSTTFLFCPMRSSGRS